MAKSFCDQSYDGCGCIVCIVQEDLFVIRGRDQRLIQKVSKASVILVDRYNAGQKASTFPKKILGRINELRHQHGGDPCQTTM